MSSRRDRIAAKIQSSIRVDEVTGCHIWQGGNSGKDGRGGGYPRMWLDGQMVAVHRVTFTNEHGFIPGKMQIDHTCRNRLCVRLDHLEMVTHLENQKRRAAAQKAMSEQTMIGHNGGPALEAAE